MSSAVSDLWGGIKSGVGTLARGVGSVASGIGDFVGMDGQFGLSGPTGQPLPGSPGATAADFSQSLKDFGGGMSNPAMSAATFSSGGPIADVSPLEQALKGAGEAASGYGQVANPTMGGGALPQIGVDAATGAAPGAETDPGFIARLMGGGGKNDWMRNLIPGGMLAYQVWQGNQPIPGVENLRGMAENLALQSEAGSNMAAQAMQGNLPGPARSAVEQALRAAQATIRGKYADLNMSGSTMEAQELGDAELRSVALRFQIGQQMAQTGLQAVSGQNNLAAQLYSAILAAETERGSDLGDALAAFAGATTR